MSPFAETLKALRLSRKLRQKEAALLLGYEQSFLSALETDAKGPANEEFVKKVIEVFNLDEIETQNLRNSVELSRRTMQIPRTATRDEYMISHRLNAMLGKLDKKQLQLIDIALQMTE